MALFQASLSSTEVAANFWPFDLNSSLHRHASITVFQKVDPSEREKSKDYQLPVGSKRLVLAAIALENLPRLGRWGIY